MAIASTPQQTVSVALGGAVTVATVTIADAPAGSALVFHWAVTNSPVQTATPSSPNTTWTQYLSTTSPGNDIEEIWVGAVAGGSTGTTVTITTLINQSLSQIRGSIQEWRGTTGTGYGIASLYDGNNAVATSPVMTPVAGKNALVLIFCRCNAGTTLTSGPTGSFTDANVSGSSLTRTAYQVVASASGTYSGAWTFGLAGREMSAGLILYDTAPLGTMTFTTQPTATATGSAMSTVVVTADAAASGLTCTLSLTGTGSVANNTAVCNGSGVATFTTLTPTGDGPGYTLTAAVTGYSSPVSTAFTIIGATVAANQALVTAVGGDTKLFSVHDPRIYANGALASFPDTIGTVGTRAAGLTFTAGTAPVVASGKLTFTAASTQSMLSAADARLNFAGTVGTPNPIWMIVFATASGTGPVAGIAKDATSTVTYPYAVVQPAGSNWKASVASDGATATPVDPPIPNTAGIFVADSEIAFADSKVRGMVLGKLGFQNQNNIDHTYLFIPGGKQPRMARRVTSATAGSCQATLGRFGASYANASVSWVGFYAGDLTVDILRAFWAFGRAQFNAQVDVSTIPSLGMTGNSLVLSTTQQSGGDMVCPTYGSGTTSMGSYLVNKNSGTGTLRSRGLDVNEAHSFIYGRSGGTLQNVIDTFDVEVALLADGTRTGPIVITYHDVGNSLAGGGMTQAQYLAACITLKGKCATLASTYGIPVKLVHLLDPDRGSYYNQNWPTIPSGYSANGTDRVAIGTTMLASPTTYGAAVFDLASLANEGLGTFAAPKCYSTTYFNITANGAFAGGDSTHQAPVGYQILGEGIKTGLFDANPGLLFPTASGTSRMSLGLALGL